jgi:cell division protein FtsN
MAQRKKRRSTRSTRTTHAKKTEYPPAVWMLFGLAIGLAVAFAVHMSDRSPTPVAAATPSPASLQGALDDNDEKPQKKPAPAVEEPADKRFTFYDILPNMEVETPVTTPQTAVSSQPQAIVEPGVYVLQAGSFSTPGDADRRRAELALHGIESRIQRVRINDRDYYRVNIGPTDDLDELNLLRSRLRAANIDVLRIRFSD